MRGKGRKNADNAQPSQKHNYQIRPTTVGVSQIDDLIVRLKNDFKISNADINNLIESNLVYSCLDAEFYERYSEILGRHSFEEILEQGILAMVE